MLRSRCLILSLWLGWLAVSAHAQTTNPYVTSPAIQQVSLERESDSAPTAEHSASHEQLVIAIRYLLVDDETRQAIYELVDSETVQRVSHHTQPAPLLDLHSISAGNQVRVRAVTHGHASNCRVSSELVEQVIALVASSPNCTSSQAPAVVLQQNQIAEVKDTIQRPMVIDVKGDEASLQPEVVGVESGIQVQLLVNLTSPQSVDLKVQLIENAIVAQRSLQVFGGRHGPTTIQSPVTVETSVTVSESMDINEQLLIDPHVRRQAEIEVPSESMFGKLPIVGKRFSKSATESIDANLMVLIKPSIFTGGQ